MAGIVLTFKVIFGYMMKLIIEVKKKKTKDSVQVFLWITKQVYILF